MSRLLPPVAAAAAGALVLAGAVTAQVLPGGGTAAPPTTTAPAPTYEPVGYRPSKAVGKPWRGRLSGAVKLPSQGADWNTWDPALRNRPNRWWRRWGHDRLVHVLLRVLTEYRLENPGVARVIIGDISRPRGGPFGKRYGGLGHRSHQNGLDVDVYYPRLDRRERGTSRVRQIDRVLAQDLVDRFVEVGARYVFVGPSTGLRGPRRIVRPLVHHDDHLHVRLRSRRKGR